MNFKQFLAASLLAVLFAAGRASAAPPVAVDLAELEGYWTPTRTTMTPDLQLSVDSAAQSETALVEIVIGREGRVTQAHVLQFSPAGSDPEWARQVAAQMHFEPAANNPERTPVTTRIPVSGLDAERLRIDGSSEDALHRSLAQMLAPLPEPEQVRLHMALMQLAVDGLGSEAEMKDRFSEGVPSIMFVRERIDGMNREEILAEAEAASRREGAPKLFLPGPANPVRQ